MHLCDRARPVSNVLQHFDPCQVILDCTLLCRMSVALFVLTEPPAHQLIKSADTVPPLRNSPFFSPSPSKRNFFLMPQNDVKDQRRRLGRCLQWNLWYSPPASMTSRLASATFKMASKVFIKETDKNFDFITEILFRFLGFGDLNVPIFIEN